MRSIRQIADELQTLTGRLIDISAELSKITAIDPAALQALAALVGIPEVQPSAAPPKGEAAAPRVLRKLNEQERAQIRLLYQQQSPHRPRIEVVLELAETFQVTKRQINGVLFNVGNHNRGPRPPKPCPPAPLPRPLAPPLRSHSLPA